MSRELNYNVGQLFKPAVNRSRYFNQDFADRGVIKLANTFKNAADLKRLVSTASFLNDTAGSAFKSSQQLNVDFSRFETHTFFNSARSKSHVAFEKILNQFPFDGTRDEVNEFLESLTGFERYVFEKLPKNTGFLRFDRSVGNVSIEVKPFEGVVSLNQDLNTGPDKLAISNVPFTVEFSLFVPSGSVNDNEVIAQRISSDHGFTLGISASNYMRSPKGSFPFYVGFSSGSSGHGFTVKLPKGKFQTISTVFDRDESQRILVYKDGELIHRTDPVFVRDLDLGISSLTIGTGPFHNVANLPFMPKQTMSGALDEFRLYSEARSKSDIQKLYNKNTFAEESMKLYYRFNEPSGSFDLTSNNANLVLDHSGNGLHAHIGSFNMILRNPLGLSNNIKFENLDDSPVLFPSFLKVSELATELVLSGTNYDVNNPNLITRLVPKHYFLDSALEENLGEEGEIDNVYTFSSDVPGKARMPSSQIISSILYLWADRFDEMKMFIDEFSRLLKVDYDSKDTISDLMLPFLAKYYGFTLPELFRDASAAQFLDGSSLQISASTKKLSLQKIQNEIWRRILSDISNILQKKGTKSAIEAVFRSMGVNPMQPYRIREYGGSTTSTINNNFENRMKNLGMLNFSGSNSLGSIGGDQIDTRTPTVVSSYLSSSRRAPGLPGMSGSLVNGISNRECDGLFTSGSWTLETRAKMGKVFNSPVTQSVVRLHTTGAQSNGTANNFLIYNLIATNDFNAIGSKGKVTLFGRPSSSQNSKILTMSVDANIFDGNTWSLSFGRFRNDLSGTVKYSSSSYYLRVGKNGMSGLTAFYHTQSFFDDSGTNVLNHISPINNASGSFLAIGQSIASRDASQNIHHLNTAGKLANVNSFSGKMRGLRFYTKAMSINETKIHFKNPLSVGAENPNLNYSFNTSDSGSFERLRVDLSMDQIVTSSKSDGSALIFDFSQNSHHGFATGFTPNTRIIHPVRFDYQILSPRFDLKPVTNKIRVRSLLDLNQEDFVDAEVAPLSDIDAVDNSLDDPRVAIEVSAVQALDEDIVNIFSSMEFFDSAIGAPENLFSVEYKDLRNARKIYFNRLQNKLSVKKFFEFFKWFDDTVGDLLEDLIPSNSKFMGTNFIFESHMLERHKMVYFYQDMYVGVIDRLETSGIFLQQFNAIVRKM